MVWISAGIREFEGDIEDIWVPPVNLASLASLDKWIIYGKKGVGKTTILDYWVNAQTSLGLTIAPVRPAEETDFFEIFDRFSKRLNGLDEHTRILAAQRFIDVRIKVALMFRWNRFKVENGGAIAAGAEQRLVTFVRNQKGGQHESEFALDLLNRLTEATQDTSDIAQAVQRVSPEYWAAADYLQDVMREDRGPKLLAACIDDIDDVTFEFGPSDRLLIKALIGYTFSGNQIYARQGTRMRTILMLPSELYVGGQMWGADKLRRYEAQLRWSDIHAIRTLVNRRIGKKLNVTRRGSHREAKAFSVSQEHTWNRCLPPTIVNRRGKEEDALEYVLRHTFYTPRELLDAIDRVKEDPIADALSLDGTHSSATEWSQLFQRKVSEAAIDSGRRFKEMMGRAISGLEPLLGRFSKRPNLWLRSRLEDFLRQEAVVLKTSDGKEAIEPHEIVGLLYRIGFIGLGSRQTRYQAVMRPNAYIIRYAFLSDEPHGNDWELAVIPPVFYDDLSIQSQLGVIVRPHADVHLDAAIEERLAKYDVASNSWLA